MSVSMYFMGTISLALEKDAHRLKAATEEVILHVLCELLACKDLAELEIDAHTVLVEVTPVSESELDLGTVSMYRRSQQLKTMSQTMQAIGHTLHVSRRLAYMGKGLCTKPAPAMDLLLRRLQCDCVSVEHARVALSEYIVLRD